MAVNSIAGAKVLQIIELNIFFDEKLKFVSIFIYFGLIKCQS